MCNYGANQLLRKLKKQMLLLLLVGLFFPGVPQSQIVAFPGAEGFGKYAKGGRGGKVYIVRNLNDSGPGSFREAAEAKHPRYILFSVSGTIRLQSPVNISKNATIAGQTAPGDGICFADYPVLLAGDNIIVRFLRFRLGDRYQNKGMVHGSGHDDAFGGNRHCHIIIDHCSMSWSTDEVFSMYGGDSSTIQWNILSEPLNYSYHFERGDKDFERHGYGGIWGGRHLSAHHNLFAHCVSRTPRFQGIRYGEEQELVDFRNNVIYNWQHNNVYGGEGGNYNMANNYYKYGPSTLDKVKNRIVNPSKLEERNIGFGKFYVEGNYVDGSAETTADNAKGIHFTSGEAPTALHQVRISENHAVVDLPFFDAETAYEQVLRHAGAVLPVRDTLDQRIVCDVRLRQGRIIDVQGGYPHGTEFAFTKNAWPMLISIHPPLDTDGDGMPDDWEIVHGLNPHNASDAIRQDLQPGYDNIEVYINSLVPVNTYL